MDGVGESVGEQVGIGGLLDGVSLTQLVDLADEQFPVEGIMSLINKRLRDMMDLKIFVDTDPDERLIRNIQRDTIDRGRTVSMVVDRYLAVLKPMHEQFIEPTKRYADLIIPQGGENKRGIAILCKYIEGLMPIEAMSSE